MDSAGEDLLMLGCQAAAAGTAHAAEVMNLKPGMPVSEPEAMALLTVIMNMIAALRAYIITFVGNTGIKEDLFVKRMYDVSELLLARIAAAKKPKED